MLQLVITPRASHRPANGHPTLPPPAIDGTMLCAPIRLPPKTDGTIPCSKALASSTGAVGLLVLLLPPASSIDMYVFLHLMMLCRCSHTHNSTQHNHSLQAASHPTHLGTAARPTRAATQHRPPRHRTHVPSQRQQQWLRRDCASRARSATGGGAGNHAAAAERRQAGRQGRCKRHQCV